MKGDPRKPFGPPTHYVAGACKRCQGKGWIERVERAEGVLPTRDCPVCGGTGKVFAEWPEEPK